jgi:putative resolvase
VVWVEAGAESGISGTKVRAGRRLADLAASVVVIEHRDRLGRMKAGLAGAALTSYGRCLVVGDDSEVTDGLVRSMMEVLPSFCARPGHVTGRWRPLGAPGVASARGSC